MIIHDHEFPLGGGGSTIKFLETAMQNLRGENALFRMKRFRVF